MSVESKINVALKKFSNGNKKEAYKDLLKIYKNNRSNNQLIFNLAVIEQDLNLYENAIIKYNYLIKNTGNFKAIINLYLLNLRQENYRESLKLIDLLIDKKIINREIIRDRAFVLFKLKKYTDSVKICESFLKNNSDDINFLNILGLNYFAKNEIDKSKKIFKKALSIDSRNFSILNSLGRVYHETRESVKAEKFFVKAFEINKDSYEINNNLAGFYREEGHYQKAIEYYERARKINPNNPSIINNLAKTYFDLDKIETALEYCLKALSINPEDGNIQKILSLIYLKKQNFKLGWKYFDGRLNLSDFIEKNTTIENIKEKLYIKKNINFNSKILVLREQGVGDEILYGTMYRDVLQNWKNVTIECDPRLKNLFINSFSKYKNCFTELGSISKYKNSIEKFDYVIYAGSLGKYFRKNITEFNNSTYLVNPKKLAPDYQKQLKQMNKKFKVGISWKSFKNRYADEKSLKLTDIEYLFENNHIDFINLQYGNVEKEIENFNTKINNKIIEIKNLDIFNDFLNLSAVLKNLDLFITVSNSTAHLAGALGVKTLLIKPVNHAVFHYWDQPSNKTPWYETITLYNRDEFLKEKKNILSVLE